MWYALQVYIVILELCRALLQLVSMHLVENLYVVYVYECMHLSAMKVDVPMHGYFCA